LYDVVANLDRVRHRIAAAGRDPSSVRIVAVTKGFGSDAIDAALAAGLTDIGENYAQEVVAKSEPLARATVHFIGRLQSNKIRVLAPYIAVWQTVDRVALADELGRRASGAVVLVQVNTSGEPHKGGCLPGEAPALFARCLEQGLRVDGLMTIGRTGDPIDARAGFTALARLADRLGLRERSMGMTDDLEVAVAEGATMIRVGSALFGPRPAKATRGN
jgi:pyridoxal phosphate enzyme (YggS family)